MLGPIYFYLYLLIKEKFPLTEFQKKKKKKVIPPLSMLFVNVSKGGTE